jgi:uncharacterized membrane protein YccC
MFTGAIAFIMTVLKALPALKAICEQFGAAWTQHEKEARAKEALDRQQQKNVDADAAINAIVAGLQQRSQTGQQPPPDATK